MAQRAITLVLDDDVARRAVSEADRRGLRLSELLEDVIARGVILESGLAAVQAWEQEHGEFTADELAWADEVLSQTTRNR